VEVTAEDKPSEPGSAVPEFAHWRSSGSSAVMNIRFQSPGKALCTVTWVHLTAAGHWCASTDLDEAILTKRTTGGRNSLLLESATSSWSATKICFLQWFAACSRIQHNMLTVTMPMHEQVVSVKRSLRIRTKHDHCYLS
jgi:hypothetical protein